jgi:hypothetical protein
MNTALHPMYVFWLSSYFCECVSLFNRDLNSLFAE